MELGGHGSTGKAADGATPSDRDGTTLSGSMTQPLATAPLDNAHVLLRGQHQCIFLLYQLWGRIEKENAEVK